MALPFLFASCQTDQSMLAGEQIGDDLQPGSKATGRLPDGTQGASARYYQFEVDSGTTYFFAWNEPESRVALAVATMDGHPEFSDSAPPPSGYEKALAFPARSAGKFRLRVSGLPGCAFELSLTASKGLPEWVVAPDSLENDIARSRAATIATDGSWHRRTLTTSGTPDVDWLRFDVDSGWTYSVAREDSLGRGISGGLFDADSQFLGEFGAVARRKSTYYYKVGSTTGRGAYYRVKILATRGFPSDALLPDAYEDDNSIAKAKPIRSDSIWQQHTLSGSLDSDRMKFHADSGTTYRVHISESDTASRYMYVDFRRWDSVQVPDERPLAVSDGVIYDFACTRSGTYFVEITAGSSRCNSYRVAMTSFQGIPALSVPEKGEPDSGIASATLLPSDSTDFVRNLHINDTDWLRIDAKAGTIYTLRETVPYTSYTWVGVRTRLLDEHERALDSIVLPKSDKEGAITFAPRKDGPLYLKLSIADSYNMWSSDRMTVQYRLSASTPSADSMEPDEAMAKAAHLVAGSTPLRRWVAGSDVDWLVFHADSGEAVSVFLEKASRDTRIALDLFSPDSQRLATMTEFVSIDGAPIRYVPRQTGNLYLRVLPAGQGVQSYAIRVVHDSAPTPGCTDRSTPCRLTADSSWIKIRIPPGDTIWLTYPVGAGRTYRFEPRATARSKARLFTAPDRVADSGYASPTSGSLNFYRKLDHDGDLVVAVNAEPRPDTSFEFRMAVSETRGISGYSTPAEAYDLDRQSGPLEGTALYDQKTYLKFIVDTARVYSFHITKTNGRSGISIVDSAGIPVYPLPGTSPDYSFRPSHPGTWFLWLQSSYGYPDATWKLERSSAPVDNYEPDDSIRLAKPIATDGVSQSRMIWGTDQDWISIAVDSGSSYSIRIQPASGGLATWLHAANSIPRADYKYWPSTPANTSMIFKSAHTEQVFLAVQGAATFTPGAIQYSVDIRKLEANSP